MKDHQRKPAAEWYKIQVEGQFNVFWPDWFEGWTITPLPDGNTLLTGPVVDQPALHGLIACLRDMNLKIISLQKIKPPSSIDASSSNEPA